jgi:hypothetical protein
VVAGQTIPTLATHSMADEKRAKIQEGEGGKTNPAIWVEFLKEDTDISEDLCYDSFNPFTQEEERQTLDKFKEKHNNDYVAVVVQGSTDPEDNLYIWNTTVGIEIATGDLVVLIDDNDPEKEEKLKGSGKKRIAAAEFFDDVSKVVITPSAAYLLDDDFLWGDGDHELIKTVILVYIECANLGIPPPKYLL